MARATWTEAVARAQRAQSGHFQGRMDIADASLSVIPQNGKGADGHTLAEFAAAIDVGYQRLLEWRQVWKWLGRDSSAVPRIPSLSVAEEAMDSGRWKTAKSFITEMQRNPTPIIERPGYEPYVAEQGWNRAVLRAYLGKPLTAELKLMMTVIQEQREPTADELYDAGVSDRADDYDEYAGQSEDPGALAKAGQRSRKSGQKLTEKAAGKTPTYVPGEESQKVLSFQEQLRALGASDLPGRIADAAGSLRRLLEDTDEFRTKFGEAVLKADGKHIVGDMTLNDLLDETLDNEATKTEMAFAAAIGAPDRME